MVTYPTSNQGDVGSNPIRESHRLFHPTLERKTARENSRTRPHSVRWLCCQHGCRGSVVATYPTSNQRDVGSNPIRGNMFFFQNLFHIYPILQEQKVEAKKKEEEEMKKKEEEKERQTFMALNEREKVMLL